MKKIYLLGLLALMFSIGCQKKDNVLLERIAKLEERIAVLEKRTPPPAAAQPEEQVSAYDIPVGKSPILGNPAAPITVVEFTDKECPFCARAHDSFVEALLKEPALQDKVKVVYKHFPLSFHKNARPASKASMAAAEQGHDCFWAYTKKLYAGQRELNDANYEKWAKETTCKKTDGKTGPLDAAKWKADLKNNDAKYEDEIKADMALGMQSGTRGTPTFFVGTTGKTFWKLSQRTPQAVIDMVSQKGLVPGFTGGAAATGNAGSGAPGAPTGAGAAVKDAKNGNH
jgi:protein-disulfide isomerase